MTRPAGGAFTGTGALLRLALRRDRLRIGIWVLVLTSTMAYTPGALRLAYPDEAQRLARVDLLATPAGIMLSGPTFGMNETDLGVMVANELTLTMVVATSILSILTVIRHTRADEENGSAELVMSSVTGRHARTTTALLLAGGLNAILALAMTTAMSTAGFGVLDSAAMCLGITAVATVFGVFAAVTAQLWRQARTATGAAMAVLAVAVLVRGVGDVIDHSGSTLSWFSPIAWAQQMRPFVDLRWWPFAMLLVLAIGLTTVAAALEHRRQYNAGIVAATGDQPDAPAVTGPLALHLRLQRGQTVGWSIGLFAAGLVFGSMTKSLLDTARDNELVARVLAATGYDGVYTTMTQFLAAAAAAYVAAAVLRVRAEEQSGLAEPILAGAVSRWHWLLTAMYAALAGAAVLMLCAGLGHGVGAGLALGEPDTILRLVLAALAQLPALAVVTAVAALAVALRAPWIAWLAVTFVIAALYLGALLRLPDWLIELSPVSQTTVPQEFPTGALVVMLVAATIVAFAAGWIYRRRDAA